MSEREPMEKTCRCPCCHHKTLAERGAFEMCPVCAWEDDGQDDSDVGVVRGGPNGTLSLASARENYRKLGASEERLLSIVRGVLPSEE